MSLNCATFGSNWKQSLYPFFATLQKRYFYSFPHTPKENRMQVCLFNGVCQRWYLELLLPFTRNLYVGKKCVNYTSPFSSLRFHHSLLHMFIPGWSNKLFQGWQCMFRIQLSWKKTWCSSYQPSACAVLRVCASGHLIW